MHLVEGEGFALTPWSDFIYIEISDVDAKDSSQGITAMVAKDNVQIPNEDENEILIGRAAPGVMELAKADSHHNLTITESIQFPNCIDNPSYFHDP